jgi:hypothetical protein
MVVVDAVMTLMKDFKLVSRCEKVRWKSNSVPLLWLNVF